MTTTPSPVQAKPLWPCEHVNLADYEASDKHYKECAVCGATSYVRKWRVGFFVTVDVVANRSEAAIVAEAACRWPGNWQPAHDGVEVHGVINGYEVSAEIIRSEAMMITEAPTNP